jgi:Flp pilus assembly protein TadD
MTGAWPLIAQLLAFPTRLSMHYGPTTVIPQRAMNAPALIGAAAFALVLVAATIVARRGDRRPLVAIGWLALAYLPASNIVVPTGQLLAERTLFLPSMGMVMLAAWVLARAETFPERALRVAFAVAVIVAGLGVLETVTRVPVWSSEERLFQSGIDYDSAAFDPYWQLARTVGRHGDNARGLALLGEAYRRYPQGESLTLEYAQHLRASGRGEDAMTVLRAASVAHPRSQSVRLAYLDALLESRGADSVVRAIGEEKGRDPAGVLRYVVLARAYETMGKSDSVTAVYARAVAEDGSVAGLRFAYASALHDSHRDVEAQRELDSAAAGQIPAAARGALEAKIRAALGDSARARSAVESGVRR